MKKSEIMDILADWNFWKTDIDAGIERPEMAERIKTLSEMNEAVVVSGVRRSGKSTLLLQFCKFLIKCGTRKEDILIVNFEDPRFRTLDMDLLNGIYEAYLTELDPQKEHYVVLDEIQAIDGWERFVRYLHENRKVHVFVTGSSSKLLASEYSTVLAGRHVDFEVYPLAFREFLRFRNGVFIKDKLDIISKRHEIKRRVSEYVRWGGFPKVSLLPKEADKKELLNTYFRDITIKDVVMRHKIKEVEKLEELAKYYLTNVSSLQSFNRIKDALNVSLDTVERFSRYLSEAYMIFFTSKFSFSKKEQLLNPKKVYCIDTGLRNAVGFVFSEDSGRLMENVVFLELKRRGSGEIFYWKGKGEVDFVVKEGTKVGQLIQACYDIDDENTKKREVSALLEAMKELGLKNGRIITWEQEGEERFEGKGKIAYIPLWKWLLEGQKNRN